jgi:hypothetical protein
MKQIIAFCGLVCSECPAFIATQANDMKALEAVAAQWRKQFNSPDMTAESILCDGCIEIEKGRIAGYCAICEIRACGRSKGFLNCGYCPDYACSKLDAILKAVPAAKANLDRIKASL